MNQNLPDNINMNWITSFKRGGKRALNNRDNNRRELIITHVINKDIDSYNVYTNPEYGTEWRQLKEKLNIFINTYLFLNIDYSKIVCIRRGGRRFNYDFDFNIYENLNMLIQNKHVEFKFNSDSVSNCPQFVSPEKPSHYLTNNFEEYHFTHYLPEICNLINFNIPNKEEYLSQMNLDNPRCVLPLQEKYYKGSSRSSKYTGINEDILFYKKCIELSKKSIYTFINNTELKLDVLSSYLLNTQQNKHYMLYKNNEFYYERPNLDDYILLSCEKKPDKSCYIATSKSGKKIKILLRWKNGNGIAHTAFQISLIK